MKKTLLIFTALIFSIILSAQTQTQQGYVKTKGRMVDGKYVPGQGLKGATVSIKGRTTVLVNGNDGSFTFPCHWGAVPCGLGEEKGLPNG